MMSKIKTSKNVRPRIAIWIDFIKIKKLFRCLPIFGFMSKPKKRKKNISNKLFTKLSELRMKVCEIKLTEEIDVKQGDKTKRVK